MAEYVGGKRARLIRESLFRLLKQNLTELGWFDANRPYTPIKFISGAQNQDNPIILNTAALSDDNDDEIGWELGSTFAEQSWQMYVDFYAENDAIGLHFMTDVRDILRGKFSVSTSHSSTAFPVFDYGQATPPILFYCDIDNVTRERAHGFLKPWLEHWYSVSFQVLDSYRTEDDD